MIKQTLGSLLLLTIWIVVLSPLVAMLFFGWSLVMDTFGAVFTGLLYLVGQIGAKFGYVVGSSGHIGAIGYVIALALLLGLFFASLAIVGAMGLLIVSAFRRVFGNK